MYSCPLGAYVYLIKSGDTLFNIAQRNQTTLQAIAALNPDIDINNLYIGQPICIPQGYSVNQMPLPYPELGISKTEEELNNQMRLLWEQHIYWTRMFILSLVFGLPDLEFVTNRLLQNPKDFAAVLNYFYGEDIAAKFNELFTDHLTIAAELVKYAKDNNSTGAIDAEKRWYENANQIAIFLSSINPYWSYQEWQEMLFDHLEMTKEEATNILTQKYADSITVLDNIEIQALEMADMMTKGIVSQFPQ